MKLRWAVLFIAMTAFIAACGGPGPTDSLAVTLAANPTSLTAAGNTTLTATITSGTATKVEFFVKGQTTAFATDNDAAGGFTATAAVPAAGATYVATATDAAGTTANSNEVRVTVSAPTGNPSATAKSVNSFKGIAVSSVAAPTGLVAVTDKLVFANGTPAKKAGTEVGGTATVNVDGTFTFVPATPTTATGSFDFEVTATGKTPATAKVTINFNDLPAGTVLLNDITAIDASTAATVIVNGAVVCSKDPCVTLAPNQKLIGGGLVGAVTLAGGKITATRGPAGGPDSATVIVMGNGSTAQGLDIAGGDIFRAVDAPQGLTGTITINDVDVDMTASGDPSFGSPIRLGGVEGATDVADPTPATFNVEGVDITGVTNGEIGIEAYGMASLTINNSSVAGATTPGVFIVGHTTTIVLDNVRVTSTATPGISIFKRAPAPAATVKDMKVTIKNTNTQITPPTGAIGIKLTGANSGVELPAAEKMIIQTGSTGNVSNAAVKVDANSFVVTGEPTF